MQTVQTERYITELADRLSLFFNAFVPPDNLGHIIGPTVSKKVVSDGANF